MHTTVRRAVHTALLGVEAPVDVSVDVNALAAGILGDASVTGTAPAADPAPAAPAPAPGAQVGGGSSDGIAAGTDVTAPLTVPVTIGDVALGVLGDASTASTGSTGSGTGSAPTTTDDVGDAGGLLTDLGIVLPITVPVAVGDVALGVVGDATVTGPGTTAPGRIPADGGTTTGSGGTAGLSAAGDAATTTVAEVAFTSGVLAATERAVVLESAASVHAVAPAALATTGGPAGLMSLAAAGLIGLGLLVRRLPRVVLG